MNDYYSTMRKLIGKETLITIGCGIILEDDKGRILLQRRKGSNDWGIPGGCMEVGETFIETATRETLEEANITAHNLRLFGIYSGSKYIVEHPDGNKEYSVQIIFHTTDFEGELKDGEESYEHRYFTKDNLPSPLNPDQSSFILDWAKGRGKEVIIE